MRHMLDLIHGLVTLLFLPLLITACQAPEINLPFDTIEEGEVARLGQQLYEAHEPGLIIVANTQDIASLDNWITNDAQTQLQALDYGNYFVIAVFQGLKSSTRYGVRIERITRQENTVAIIAQFQEPTPEHERNPLVTSPYRLVRVRKVGSWDKVVRFNLIANRAMILSASHHIP